jgi:hypothetical protein
MDFNGKGDAIRRVNIYCFLGNQIRFPGRGLILAGPLVIQRSLALRSSGQRRCPPCAFSDRYDNGVIAPYHAPFECIKPKSLLLHVYLSSSFSSIWNHAHLDPRRTRLLQYD